MPLICNCNANTTFITLIVLEPQSFSRHFYISLLLEAGVVRPSRTSSHRISFIQTHFSYFWENLKNQLNIVFKFYSRGKDFSLTSATMQVTNFPSGKVPKLKRLLCERCSYVPCPSNVLCNFPSSKLFSTLDEVSGNASLFLTYNIIHCTPLYSTQQYRI